MGDCSDMPISSGSIRAWSKPQTGSGPGVKSFAVGAALVVTFSLSSPKSRGGKINVASSAVDMRLESRLAYMP